MKSFQHCPTTLQTGVDLSLIGWFLSLLSSERLAFLEERVADIVWVRALNDGEPLQTFDAVVLGHAPTRR